MQTRLSNKSRAVDSAQEAITARSGQERDILWIPLADLITIVHEHAGASDAHRFEFTLHGGGTIDGRSPDVAALTAQHRCSIAEAGPGWALVRNDIEREGHATPVLERLTGCRATSRGLPTLIRLVARFAD